MRELPVDRLTELSPMLPHEVIQDISKRMGNWVLGGGNPDDPYMWQQVRYAENWINIMGEK